MFIAAALLLSFAPACNEALESAANALRQQDVKSAENILQTAADPCSESPEYFELRGVASQFAGNLPAAQSSFEKSLLLRPGSPTVLTRLGAIYFQEKRLPDAVRVLGNALRADPKNVAAGKLLAGSYVGLRLWKSADEVFQQFGVGPAANPLLTEPLTVMWFAQTLIEMQPSRLDAELSPDTPGMTPDLLFSLAGLFEEHRLYNQEIRFLSKIPEQAADDAVYFNLGLAYSKLRQFENARDCYFKAIDKHPQHVDAYLHVGIDYANQGDPRKSLPWLMRAHRLAPDRCDAAYAVTQGLIELQYFDTADQILRETRALSPADRSLLDAATGDLSLAQGNSEHALDIYGRLLKTWPNSVPAMVGMARARESQGKNAEAEVFLKQALALDPENSDINAQLGLVQVKQSEDEDALRHLKQAWLANHADGKVALAMARIYERQDKPAEALAVLDPIERSQDESRDYQLELAKLHRMLGQHDAERTALGKLAALESEKKGPLRFENPKVYVFERD